VKIAILGLTAGGKLLAEKISSFFEDSFIDNRDLPVFKKLSGLWQQKVDAIVCIMATGIVVRGLASLCNNKKTDPCVLVLDENGQFVISLLSGHLGGGNQLAKELADFLGGQAVITTASDVTGHTSLDLWAKKNGLGVGDSCKLTEKSAKLINRGMLALFTELEIEALPHDLTRVANPELADIIISDTVYPGHSALILSPCALSVGLGCNRGTPAKAFEVAVTELFYDSSLNLQSIRNFASIDLKSDEQGLLQYANQMGIPVRFYTKEELNRVDKVSSSAVVFAATGAKGVAEPAAVLAAGSTPYPGKLIIRKRKWKDVTVAVAMKQTRIVA